MEQLNTIKFISNAVEKLTEYKNHIKNAENYEKARSKANAMMGYIDCLLTFNNTMPCMENSGFTEDFDDLMRCWHEKTCQALIDKAISTEQKPELIYDLRGIQEQYKDKSTEIKKDITDPANTEAETAENELRKWADRAAQAAKEEYILDYKEIHGIRMTLIGQKKILVFGEIYRLAHILGVRVKERYEPERELTPFIYEFEYNGITFRHISAEHTTVPAEYADAKCTKSYGEEQAAV